MFDPTTLVGFHTWLSLIALGAGVVVIMGLISGRAMPAWTAVFLLTATSTSATGFALPFERVLPSHIVGGLALVALAVALLAQYRFRLAGAWRWLYAVAAYVSLTELRNNTVMLAKLATLLKIPVITTASEPNGPNGPLMPEIHQFAPHAVYVGRKG